jgi:hypothetical protein
MEERFSARLLSSQDIEHKHTNIRILPRLDMDENPFPTCYIQLTIIYDFTRRCLKSEVVTTLQNKSVIFHY